MTAQFQSCLAAGNRQHAGLLEQILDILEEIEQDGCRAFEQQLLAREHWAAARIGLLQKRLELLAREYFFELALSELESVVGFRWPGLESLPIN